MDEDWENIDENLLMARVIGQQISKHEILPVAKPLSKKKECIVKPPSKKKVRAVKPQKATITHESSAESERRKMESDFEHTKALFGDMGLD